MKSSNSLVALLTVAILGSIAPAVYSQNAKVLNSQNTTFTFSQCVANICVRQMRVFQENVEQYIPARTEWAGGGDSGVGSFGGTKTPAHWERYDRATMVANVSFPSCPNQHHLEGSVTLTYRNGSAYFTRTYEIQRSDENQNRDITWTIKGYFGNPSSGTADFQANSICRYHGVNNRGGPKWAPWNW